MFTVQLVALSPSQMMRDLHEQMSKNYSASEAQINQVIAFLAAALPGSGPSCCVYIFVITLLPALGGAVGAKLLNRQ